MTMPMIQQGILEAAWSRLTTDTMDTFSTPAQLRRAITQEPPSINTAYIDLQNTWKAFVDSLMRKWKALHIISVLLLLYVLPISGSLSVVSWKGLS